MAALAARVMVHLAVEASRAACCCSFLAVALVFVLVRAVAVHCGIIGSGSGGEVGCVGARTMVMDVAVALIGGRLGGGSRRWRGDNRC
jgi:hypothetical protein